MNDESNGLPPPSAVVVIPVATADELAAIMAAYRALWPKPVEVTASEPVSTAWRFSGRWFANDLAKPSSRWS